MKLQFSVIVKLNSDMTFYQNSPPKQKKITCGMKKLKRLHENEKKQTITISIATGTYDTEVIVDLINQAIQDNEDLQTYRQKAKLVLSYGESFFPRNSKDYGCSRKNCFLTLGRN